MRAQVVVGTLVAAGSILVALALILAAVAADSTGSLTLTPTSGPVGTVVIGVGTGFTGDTTCQLSATPAGILSSSSCTITGGGNANIEFTVSTGTPTGSYVILVVGNSGTLASAIFTVTPATTTATTATTTSIITSTATSQVTSSTTKIAPLRCIIATAAHGSEVSPAVQFLRSFRDRLVLSTRAGSAFMEVFNAWYYSFSPSVAGLIAGNDPLRAAVRVILYPLFGALGLGALAYSILSGAPDFAIVIAGLVASSLIGLIYLTPFTFVGMRALTKRRNIKVTGVAKGSMILLAAALALLAAGEAFGSFLLLAAASSAVVLICLIAAPTIAALAIARPKPQ